MGVERAVEFAGDVVFYRTEERSGIVAVAGHRQVFPDQCPGATSAPCTCELQRKPLPSRKRNRRSEAAAISVALADQNPYLIRRRRSADEVVTVRRDGVEDHLDQIAWRAGLFMVNGGNTANDFRFF